MNIAIPLATLLAIANAEVPVPDEASCYDPRGFELSRMKYQENIVARMTMMDRSFTGYDMILTTNMWEDRNGSFTIWLVGSELFCMASVGVNFAFIHNEDIPHGILPLTKDEFNKLFGTVAEGDDL